jgi:hypothetical protein
MVQMLISRNKDNTACAVFEIEGQRFFIPQISMNYVRPTWGELNGKTMIEMFAEAEAKLLSPSSVKLTHPSWDDELVLHADEYRTVAGFGSGTFYSVHRGMQVKVFQSVRNGQWDTDSTHDNW